MINFQANLQEHFNTMQMLEPMFPQLEQIAKRMCDALAQGGKIFWMGNGGSAADSQHLAAELIGRFKKERPAIPSIALSTDTSILTCLSNDYDFSIVFSRQLEALCQPQDVVVGLSTSGNSANILKGVAAAKNIGAYTIGLSGNSGGQLATAADVCITIPSTNTARIQEAHIFIGHSLCEWIEEASLKN
jgi:D-sedoheptulose 7-phosphate isomerase